MGAETVIVEAADEELVINNLVSDLQPFDITEIVRTGKIAMRLGKTHKVNFEKINEKEGEISWKPEQVSSYQY